MRPSVQQLLRRGPSAEDGCNRGRAGAHTTTTTTATATAGAATVALAESQGRLRGIHAHMPGVAAQT